MKCPDCKEKDLVSVLTDRGVEVDYCKKCGGIWLDKGEIYHFAENPAFIGKEIEEGIKRQKPGDKLCPKTGEAMGAIPLMDGALSVDYCPKTGGLWFDGKELEKLSGMGTGKLKILLDKNTVPEKGEEKAVPPAGRIEKLSPLPNLGLRSFSVLAGLYGLLTIVMIFLVQYGILTPATALIVGVVTASAQFILGPFIMDISLKLFYSMSWVGPADLPPPLKDFIRDTCAKNNMRFPRIGVIRDGSPNAFTYGHHPNNARIVISRGLIDLLGERELEAVVAHEIGHAKHRDMLVMTIAAVVPLILYCLYRTLINIRTAKRDKTGPYRYMIAIASYILYIISEYIVLWFSRTREYFADRFSGQATGSPEDLASALVKIGYGLAGREKEGKTAEKRSFRTEAIGAMGIFDYKTARTLAVSSYSPARKMGGDIDRDTLKGAMRWDMWNPWAKYYELHSTHPLISNRLRCLSEQSLYMGRAPYVVFDEKKPESYWDEFFVDAGVRFLPLISILISAGLCVFTGDARYVGLGIFLTGLSFFLNVRFSYPGKYFPEMTVSSLLKKVKVSSVRPVPCSLAGTIIGRGVSGLVWSEDFVMQDETGIIFLDYRQPLKIVEFFFGLLRAGEMKNEKVTLTGWYRRSPTPYVELKTITVPGKTRTCYVYNAKLIMSIVLIMMGLAFILS